MTHCILAHCRDRGPWSVAQQFLFAALGSRPGSIKHSVEAAGGWPENAVNAASWTLPANPNADDSSAGYPAGNGYTNIEEWLHGLAAQVEGSDGGGGAPSVPDR